MAQRRLVLVREDRLGHRLEQRHEALQSVGQRPGAKPPAPGRTATRQRRCRGRKQAQCSNRKRAQKADPVGRVGEQPRHRGARHFQGRRCAVAIPAPPGTDDPACVGLDFDLDDGRGTLAVRHVGLRRNRNTPAHPSADCALRFVSSSPAAACGHGRRPPLLTALAPGARLLSAARSCARRAPSTTRSQSREAWQAALPGSRFGPARPSLPCAAGRPPCAAT